MNPSSTTPFASASERPPARSPCRATRSSSVPTPPLAITGSVTVSSTAPSWPRSGPVMVPSRPISVTTRADAPLVSSWPATSRRSSPVESIQPRTATSRPRASSPTAIFPGWRVASSSTSSGRSIAPVPTTTRAAPAAKRSPPASTLRTPPLAWTRHGTAAQIASTTARLTRSPVRAASRSTTWIHRAPAAAKACATCTGSSPYTVSASKSPRCSRTTCPPRRSIEGYRSNGTRLQGALRRRHPGALDLHRVAQAARDALERRLDDVVAVLARQRPHVQRDPGRERERPPELLGQLRVEGADPLGLRVDLVDEERATGQVERHLDERLVERHDRAREPAHAGLVAQRVLERGTEHDADVFDRVVSVDREVAFGIDAQVPAAVLAELLQHVVEERDPGRRARLAGAVDVERELNLGLLRLAVLLRRPAHATLTSSTASRRAARKVSFSSGVPTVTRRHSASRGQSEKSRTRTPRSTSRCQRACPSPCTRTSTKLAPDGNTVTPSTAPSSARSRSRSWTRSETRSSISEP